MMSEYNVTTYTTLVVVSLSLGFWVGTRAGNRIHRVKLRSRTRTEPPAVRPAAFLQSRTSKISNAGTGNETDGILVSIDNLASLRANAADGCTMVLVVRTDLGMTSGKIAAQCSHATLAYYKKIRAEKPALLRQWERSGQTKVLRCKNEEELLLLEAQA